VRERDLGGRGDGSVAARDAEHVGPARRRLEDRVELLRVLDTVTRALGSRFRSASAKSSRIEPAVGFTTTVIPAPSALGATRRRSSHGGTSSARRGNFGHSRPVIRATPVPMPAPTSTSSG